MIKSSLSLKFCNKLCRMRSYSSNSPLKRICVIGSGPAGFFTADRLIKSGLTEVDIYEKLPVPFGLIRYGVAPDHTEMKRTDYYTAVAKRKHCQFFGNVNVGQDITIPELFECYHAIILAYGAEKDKNLGIPGENSKNVLPSREFVSWYNGHPDFQDLKVNLDCETAIVIGNGNVALDVSRILLQKIDVLAKTDIAEQALEQLKKSRIQRVIVAGRRGPHHVSFNTKEFRSMLSNDILNVRLHSEDFIGLTKQYILSLEKIERRRLLLLWETSQKEIKPELSKSFELKFYRNPKAVISDSLGKVVKVAFGINKLKNKDLPTTSEVIDTGKEDIIPCGLVIKSIGYESTQIDPSIPFDEKRKIVSNIQGRVTNKPGLYCCGWVQTGAQGIIPTTQIWCNATVHSLVSDIKKGKLDRTLSSSREDILNLIMKRKGSKYVSFEDWIKIDNVELLRGEEKRKARDKICSREEMLRIATMS